MGKKKDFERFEGYTDDTERILDYKVLPVVVSKLSVHVPRLLSYRTFSHYSELFDCIKHDISAWYEQSSLPREYNMSLSVTKVDHHGICTFKFKTLFKVYRIKINFTAYASWGVLWHRTNYTYVP